MTSRSGNLGKAGTALGLLSLALGAAEVLGGKRIARSYGARRHSSIVRAFGVREIATGALMLARPTSSVGPMLRVAGDLLDLCAIGATSQRRHASRKAVIGGAAFVLAALAADVAAAVAMRGNEKRAATR